MSGLRRVTRLQRLRLRCARWDRSCVELVDPHTEQCLATLYPLDKTHNDERGRRALEPVNEPESLTSMPDTDIAPLLKHLLAEYAATGLPPAYLPFDPEDTDP